MRVWIRYYLLLVPFLWLSAVPWLLFPTLAPGLTAVSLLLLLFTLLASTWVSSPGLSESPLNWCLVVFLLLTGVAYLVSPLPEVGLPKLTAVFLGVTTFFLLLPKLRNVENIERLVPVLAVCAGMVALAGFFTLEWPERQVINLQPITGRLPHLSGDFSINYNEMAGTLLVFFPFVVAAVRKRNGRFSKTVYSTVLVLVLTLLFFTQSRGALLGLFVIGLTWWFWGRLPIRRILLVVALVGIGLMLVGLVAGISTADIFEWLSVLDAGSKQGDVQATSWLARLEMWRVAGEMVADYPVIGGGLYTFDPVSRANYVYETILPSFNMTHAHNLILQTGTSLGVGGILALVGIWGSVLVELWRVGRSVDERRRGVAAVFGASVVGYLFFNLFDTITFGQKPGLFVWVVLAGGTGLVLEGERFTKLLYIKKDERNFRRLVVTYSPLWVLVGLLLSPAFQKNLANLRLDKARFQTKSQMAVRAADFVDDVRRAGLVYYLAGDDEQALARWRDDADGGAFVESQGTIALMSGRFAEAVEWYDLALVLAPDSAEAYLWRGIANEERGTIRLAEVDFQQAAAFSAQSEASNSMKAYIHYRLGNLMVEKEDWQAAADAFYKATQYEPDENWYYRELGDALVALGDREGAAAAYQKAEN